MTREAEYQERHRTTPTGDDIAGEIEHMGPHQTNLSRVAELLTVDHAHRPGLYQADLSQVNKTLHDQGILADVELVGVRGQDLVARDGQGHVRVYDSKNINYSYEDNGGNYDDKFGKNKGTFGYNADGSGIYKVAAGDNTWSIAGDILKNQGVKNPTANQQANYRIELSQANPGMDLHKLHVGDELTIPPSTTKLDSISAERASISASQAYAELNTNYSAATVALANHSGFFGNQHYMDASQLKGALNSPDTAAVDRPGLEFLSRNFETLKEKSGGYYKNCITEDSLADWKADQARHIDDRKTGAFLDRVSDLTRRKV